MTREEFQALYDQGPDALLEFINGLEAKVAILGEMEQKIVFLSRRVEELEARLNLNSRNSSKPPSSDITRSRSLRKKSRRKSGGQKGHPGTTLEMSQTPDETVTHSPEKCDYCGNELQDSEVIHTEKRQGADIPEIRLLFTEHISEIRRCSECGHDNRGEFPAGVEHSVQYGNRIRSFALYLMQYQLLPFDRTQQALEDLFSCQVSEATLSATAERCCQNLESTEEEIRKGLINEQVLNCDETGMYVNGGRHWLHVAASGSATLYGYSRNRGKAGADSMEVLPVYEGTIVHDNYGFYQNYTCRHALCNAHLLRELQAVMEEKRQERWAGSMTDLLLKIKAQVDKAISRGDAHLSRRQLREIEKEYERILKQGLRLNKLEKKDEHTRGRAKQSKARNLLDRLNKYKDQVLLFMKDFLVPFDNNQAERDLRMMKVKQKISGCLRSPKGAMIFCRIRSYLSTMKKQGKNLLWAIQQALIGFPIALSPPP